MKRLFNKKSALSIVIAILLIGSTQVYAATVLDINLVNYLKSGFQSFTEYFIHTSDEKTSKIETDRSNELKKYIETSSKQTVGELEKFNNNEISRADKELDSYVDEIKKQINSVVTEEKTKAKQKITEHINTNIENIKTNLNKDMEKYMKDYFNK